MFKPADGTDDVTAARVEHGRAAVRDPLPPTFARPALEVEQRVIT